MRGAYSPLNYGTARSVGSRRAVSWPTSVKDAYRATAQ